MGITSLVLNKDVPVLNHTCTFNIFVGFFFQWNLKFRRSENTPLKVKSINCKRFNIVVLTEGRRKTWKGSGYMYICIILNCKMMNDQLHSNNKGAIPEYSTLILNPEILITILVLNIGRGPGITILFACFCQILSMLFRTCFQMTSYLNYPWT